VEVDVVSTSSQPLDIMAWRQMAVTDSLSSSRRVDNYDEEEIVDPLTQLAIIATGPHSPLLHNNLALTAYQRYSLYTVYMSDYSINV